MEFFDARSLRLQPKCLHAKEATIWAKSLRSLARLIEETIFACLERTAKTPHGSLGAGQRCDSSACSEDIRCRGRSVGTRFEEILPSAERCDQKSVFLGAPLSRCYHEGGMQRRLSARSSGVVESSRSGGGSDSELNHVRTLWTNHGRGRTCSGVSYSDTATTRSADQLEHCSDRGCTGDPVQSRIDHLGCLMGIDSISGQRS
jgi:hypothetical protein